MNPLVSAHFMQYNLAGASPSTIRIIISAHCSQKGAPHSPQFTIFSDSMLQLVHFIYYPKFIIAFFGNKSNAIKYLSRIENYLEYGH